MLLLYLKSENLDFLNFVISQVSFPPNFIEII